ncbi:MAG: FAD-binding protein [Planctomycetes bacterium]|nr:FAD-binding protein [Planctomycetota bacterium]
MIERLRAAVGPERLFTSDLEKYSHDETEDFEFPPDVAVCPASAVETAEILKIARGYRIPITPQAGRTGLSGGALCVHRGIALSMERMNRILDIDERNLFCVAQPGVVTQTLQDEVEARGLFYPPDPSSRGSCTIGGNVAHNAGGPRALKYGVTRDWVTGLEFVTTAGDILRTGGKLMKNVAGYSLTHLLVGSEGTLAPVTEITLKLIPRPAIAKTMLAPFQDVAGAARAVTEIFKAKLTPCACEYMDRAAVAAAEARTGKKLPVQGGEAYLLVEVDGNEEALLDRDLERIADLCMKEGAPDVFLAAESEKRRFLWEFRRSIGEAVKALSAYKEEDTVVPRARLPELVQVVQQVARAHGLTAVCYGHVGDGNLHVNILKGELSEDHWRRGLDPAVRELFARTVAMGGQITGEHGVGYVQRNYMTIAYSKPHLDLMRRLKKVFDPEGILNPGKVLPDEEGR